jgi:hypothetical protein
MAYVHTYMYTYITYVVKLQYIAAGITYMGTYCIVPDQGAGNCLDPGPSSAEKGMGTSLWNWFRQIPP